MTGRWNGRDAWSHGCGRKDECQADLDREHGSFTSWLPVWPQTRNFHTRHRHGGWRLHSAMYTRVSATLQPFLEGSLTHKPLETYPPVRCQAGNLSFAWPPPLLPQGEPNAILLSKQPGHSPMSRMATFLTHSSSTFHLNRPQPLPPCLAAPLSLPLYHPSFTAQPSSSLPCMQI